MFKFAVSSLLGVLAMSSVAMATSNPIADLVGKYRIESCGLDGFNGLEKVTTRIYPAPGGVRVLRVFGYNGYDKEEFTVYLGSGVRDALGTDGTETWSTSIQGSVVTFKETFERENSNWPDLVRDTTTTFDLQGENLVITVEAISRVGHGGASRERCVLTSVSGDKNEIQAFDLATLQKASLESLVTQGEARMGDLDQAEVHSKRVSLTVKEPSIDQIKEVLSVAMLSNFPDDGGLLVEEVASGADMAERAKAALGTVLTIAEDAINEGEARSKYRNLFKLEASLAETLRETAGDQASGVRAYYVDWADSDSDGKGILFIDTKSGEALYLGGSYFG